MTALPTNVITDANVPDGVLIGFDGTGAMIVSLQYMPTYKRLTGEADDEKNVTAWHVSPGGHRRLACIAAWRAYGDEYPTAGSA